MRPCDTEHKGHAESVWHAPVLDAISRDVSRPPGKGNRVARKAPAGDVVGRFPAGICIPQGGTGGGVVNGWLSGEWAIQRTSARTRRTLHYWATVLWLTVGTVVWVILRDVLWFVGFMSLYAIWVTHLAGWAAETPVEEEAPVDEADATTTASEPAATSQEAAA